MRTTTVATIDTHSASLYCVLLYLCVLSIVWQNAGYLRVAVLVRRLSCIRVVYPSQIAFSLMRDDHSSHFITPVCPLPIAIGKTGI